MRKFILLFVFVALNLISVQAQVSFTSSASCYGQLSAMQGANATTDTVATWAWDLDNDLAFDDAWGQSTNFIFSAWGSQTVGLKVTFTNGGSDSITQGVVIHPLPEVNFNVDNLCKDDEATFTDNSTISSGTITAWNWTFDNGMGGDVGQVVTYNHGGTSGFYDAKLECTSNELCKSSTTKINEVFNKPTADFTTSGVVETGSSTSFINTTVMDSTGTVEVYLWDFGDGKGSSIEEPSHQWDTALTFTVQLVAISNKDCRDTMTKEIVVAQGLEEGKDASLGVQSVVVTPNGDGINDFLVVRGLDDYTGCSVHVYNRWNESVYANETYSNTDDSRFPQDMLDAGVYYYIIKCDDDPEVLGVFNILR